MAGDRSARLRAARGNPAGTREGPGGLVIADGASTLIEGGSFAYRAIRPMAGEADLYEFGAHGHGPDADRPAGRLVEQIQVWDHAHRADRASYRVFPAGTPDKDLPAGPLVRDKRHSRIAIPWTA
ncbi:hypothetical protein [Polymorphospora rubra]|uniref:hypothetical protein n=1 Tax=Polymorphospora rubra TaxID=338584 RepID=UPI00340230E2